MTPDILSLVEDRFGDAMLCVSGCLRGLFVAAPGHELICSDFNSIEGVVAACVAGEDWRVDMFRTHGKAYELGASKITGIPFAEIMAHAGYDDVTSPEWWKHRARKGEHHPVRQTIGKVSELASQFQGWIGAWKRFGADKFMDDEEIKRSILAWRKASPAIEYMWGGQERREGWERISELFGLEGMAICAIQNRGQIFPVRRLDGTDSGISYLYHGDALYCLLPSGFPPLTYRHARLVPSQRPWGGPYAIEYEGYNSNPQMGPIGWVVLDLYSGKAFENVVQKLARDVQRHAMLALERSGYPIVLHTYDEDVAEVKIGKGSVEEAERIMGAMPAWATYKGLPWPIRASGGWAGYRYRKA